MEMFILKVGDHYMTGKRIEQPTTAMSRAHEAAEFRRHFNVTWPTAIDNPEAGDPFLNLFGAWPTRFYLIQNGRFSYIAEPCQGHLMHIEDIEAALDNALATATQNIL